MSISVRNMLRCEHNRDGHKFLVMFNWCVSIIGLGIDYVKKGFWTDYASIPRLLWFWYDPLDYREEGTLHDWLYKEQKWNGQAITRKQADEILFKFVLQKHGRRVARDFYYGVRIGGRKPWNKYKKDRRIKNERIHRNLLNKIDNKIKG